MRRLEMILLMLVGILCFMACQKDNEEVPSLPDYEEVPTVSDQQCNFDAAQQQKTITLDGLKAAIANVSKAEGMDWVSNVTPLAYGSGAPNVMITLTENTSMDARTGLIVFTDTKGNKVNLMITQTGVAYQPQNYAHQVRVGAAASSEAYTLSDLSTAISTIESNASWASGTKQSYTSGAPSISLKIEANDAMSERQAVLTITAVNGDKVLLTIIQEAYTIDDIHNSETNKPAYIKHR